jgi:aspartyl-tRNA(Asn)/glutamyl-tRNA(Gln) amidotransferase subunit B
LAKPVCNWITTELLGYLKNYQKTISESPVSPGHLAHLVGLVQSGKISGRMAKDAFLDMFDRPAAIDKIMKGLDESQPIPEATVATWCDEAIAEMPNAVKEYKDGKERAIGSLVGLVMKKSQGKANPQLVNQILTKKLK